MYAARRQFTTACLQLGYPAVEDVATRVQRVAGEIGRVAPRADLVVLPELWDVRYFDFGSYGAVARPLLEGPVGELGQIAAELGVTLVAGSVLERWDGQVFNTIAVVGPDGALLGSYRKMHLFSYDSREAGLLDPGDGEAVVETPVGRLGLATCFDLRFPEQFGRMRELGADVFVVPAAWPSTRVEDWQILCRARAIENQTPLVACNGAGPCAGVELAGASVVLDAKGRVQAACDADPGVLVGVVDHDLTESWRREFPVRRELATAG